MIPTCDECCEVLIETPDTINGRGQYCSKCIDRMFEQDMFVSSQLNEEGKK